MMPKPAQSRPMYVLTLQAAPGRDHIRALRAVLKRLLRHHGLRCIALRETTNNRIRASRVPPAARDLQSGCAEPNRPERRAVMVTRQEAFPSRWLQASDFPKPAVLEIVETNQETVRGNDGRNAKKLVLYFRGQRKGLIVNATNFDSVATITGEVDSDNWIGHSIVATTTEMGGKTTPCIRARKPGAALKKTAVVKAAKPVPEEGEFSETENPAPRDADSEIPY
jgi:hypothetical protein